MANAAAAPAANGAFKRVLGALDMTLFTVCAILVIDTLAASAAIGPSSMTWWVITLVLFFIPYGLMTAELGAAYPAQGGIQDWVRRAFGDGWAARTSWYYWINVALWMPSVYILFAGMFAQLFWPEMNLWAQIGLGIAMSWLTVGIGIVSLEIGKWVPNLGAVIKAGIMLILGGGGIWYAMTNGPANEFSLATLTPGWDASLGFLPVIVYNYLGFELMSGAGAEMKNPGRDVPVAVVTAGVLIAAFYLLATFGILASLSLDDIGLIEGLLDTIAKIFGEGPLGEAMVMIVGIGALYTFLANMVTWSMGANRTAQAAAESGELPEVFKSLHPVYRTPVGAYLITGIVSTAVMIAYGLIAGTAEDLFWTLFAFSSIIFLLPYLIMFPAFVVLRRKDAATPRPYRFPGGDTVAMIAAGVCMVFILQAIVFFIWVPGEPVDWLTTGSLIGGIALTLVIGEIIVWTSGGTKRA